MINQSASYDRVDVVFDRYRSDTIKGNTRSNRTKNQRPIRKLIEHEDVPLPTNWSNYMALPENKAEYANFLSEQLKKHAPFDKNVEMNWRCGHPIVL